jgi:hypothetical protein
LVRNNRFYAADLIQPQMRPSILLKKKQFLTGDGFMKQKFTLIKDEKHKKFIIKEYAELDKDILSLLCEETYNADLVTEAIAKDTHALVAILRTKNMYPPSAHMEQIVKTVVSLFESEGDDTKELLLNDIDLLAKEEEEEIVEIKDASGDDGDVDDLLDDDTDDEVEKGLEIKKLKTSLKIKKTETGDDDPDD